MEMSRTKRCTSSSGNLGGEEDDVKDDDSNGGPMIHIIHERKVQQSILENIGKK